MKIKFISLIIITTLMQGFLFESFAQSEATESSSSSSGIGYGGKLGFNTSAFSNYEDSTYSDFGCGMSIGAFATYELNDMFFVSGELSYIKRKASDINKSIIFGPQSPLFKADYLEDSETNVVLHNIETTLKINAYLPTGDRSVKPKVFLGGSFGYILKANAITERAFDQEDESITKSNVTERFVYIDYTALIGAGVDIILDDFDLTIDLGYKFGLNDINNVTGYQPFSTNTLELLIGIKF